jgi:hypothetical protein
MVARVKLEAAPERDQFRNFFTTYNRTAFQDRVADLKAVAQFARTNYAKARIVLIGTGEAGLAAIAAAPFYDAVVADCDQLDDSRDENLLDPKIFFPGLRRMGSVQGMAVLAAPHPLFLHNTAGKIQTGWLKEIYSKTSVYRELNEKTDGKEIAKWIGQLENKKAQEGR